MNNTVQLNACIKAMHCRKGLHIYIDPRPSRLTLQKDPSNKGLSLTNAL